MYICAIGTVAQLVERPLEAWIVAGSNPAGSTQNLSKLNRLFEMEDENKESGFYDLPQVKNCKNPSHQPPTHIHIPQGKGYRHVCPSCGKVTNLNPPQISF